MNFPLEVNWETTVLLLFICNKKLLLFVWFINGPFLCIYIVYNPAV